MRCCIQLHLLHLCPEYLEITGALSSKYWLAVQLPSSLWKKLDSTLHKGVHPHFVMIHVLFCLLFPRNQRRPACGSLSSSLSSSKHLIDMSKLIGSRAADMPEIVAVEFEYCFCCMLLIKFYSSYIRVTEILENLTCKFFKT